MGPDESRGLIVHGGSATITRSPQSRPVWLAPDDTFGELLLPLWCRCDRFHDMKAPRRNLARLKGKIVTIDGPAGSGKSTTARMLAAQLGYQYLDTGAMYRALTYFAMKNGVAAADSIKLEALARNLSFEFESRDDINRVFINGEDVTEAIRTPEVTREVSQVSAHEGVRKAMVAKQRQIGAKGSVVAEGRDMATVVFPNAHFKFYMDASIEVRAQRRLLDLVKMGETVNLEEIIEDIKRRDNYDSTREHSPLKRARSAYVVDTTNMTVEGQTEHILSLIMSLAK